MAELKLSLSGWRLNAARILSSLRDLVGEKGGEMVDDWVFPREETIYLVKDENHPRTPELRLKCKSTLQFKQDGAVIFVQLGRNPFLDCTYAKEKVNCNTVSTPMNGKELNMQKWFRGKDEYAYLKPDEIRKNAHSLYEYLIAVAPTQPKPTRERRAIRVYKDL